MIARLFRVRLVLPGLVVLTSLLVSSFAVAQSIIPVSADQLRTKAIDLEKSGKWQAALQVWLQINTVERQSVDVREHLHVCVRHLLQHQRFIDDSVRQKLVSLKHTEAVALYGEVLSKLHMFYVDRSKVSPSRLYQQGLEEYLAALSDPTFRATYLKDVSDEKIRLFQAELRSGWAEKDAGTIKQARDLVTDIAVKSSRELNISKPTVVIVEFLAGACNSLDEYSAYLSPNQLLADGDVTSQASVSEVGMLRDGIGYFRITQFKDTTATELDAALDTLRMSAGEAGLRAVIMDLRGNSGGLFSSAIQVSARFLTDGVIVTTQGSLPDVNKAFHAAGGANVVALPLIVLVDAETASAAEAVAAALRDQNRATLVGATTFGKGSVQRVISFTNSDESDDSAKSKARMGGIRITLARFYSPNGQAVSGIGIAPHIVELNKTRQLEAALEQAARFASTMMMPMSP